MASLCRFLLLLLYDFVAHDGTLKRPIDIPGYMLTDTASSGNLSDIFSASFGRCRAFDHAQHPGLTDNVQVPISLKNLLFVSSQRVGSLDAKYNV